MYVWPQYGIWATAKAISLVIGIRLLICINFNLKLGTTFIFHFLSNFAESPPQNVVGSEGIYYIIIRLFRGKP